MGCSELDADSSEHETNGEDVEDGDVDYISDDNGIEEELDELLQIADLPAEVLVVGLAEVLTSCQPFPVDGLAVDPTYMQTKSCFIFIKHCPEIIEIYNRVQGFKTHISLDVLRNETFRSGLWFAERCVYNQNLPQPWKGAQSWMEARPGTCTTMWMFEPEEEPRPSLAR